LQSAPSGGFTARDFSVAEIIDAIELRGVLEGTAARFAAERYAGAGALEPLAAAVESLDRLFATGAQGSATFEAYVELNEVFHARLLELANSSMLERAMARAAALPFASPSAFLHAQSETPQSFDVLKLGQEQHRALLEAIAGREGARAEAVAREHARLARRNLSAVLDQKELFRKVPGAALIRADDSATVEGAQQEDLA
jgi:GntR family transcriptional regulator of vanillate catabolism